MKIKFCPKCKMKSEIMLYLGGKLGSMYQCKRCGLVQPIFPEIELSEVVKSVKNNKNKIKN